MKTAKKAAAKSSPSSKLSPKVRAKLPGMAYSAHWLAFSPDGKLLASGRHGNDVLLTRTDNGTAHKALTGADRVVTTLAFSPDGKRLAVADTGDAVTVWDVAGGKQVQTLAVKGTTRHAAFSPDGKTLAGAVGKSVVVWDVAAGTVAGKFDSKGIVEQAAFLPDGRLVSKAGKRIDVRNLKSGACVTIEDKNSALGFDASSDGKTILTAPGGKRHATLWDSATSKERVVLEVDDDGGIVYAAGLSPDGKRAFTMDADANLRLWDTTSGELLTTWAGPDDDVTGGACFSPDGKLLAAQYAELHLYDLASHNLAAKLDFVADEHCLAFSPDGRLIAAGSDEAVMLWALR